ncbi:MAG: hypothetical protein QG594_1618 [Bacteroidota bacterium]|jgi:hypothetical protein|nr:hypothetical protein [Bacteroidota bacterium]
MKKGIHVISFFSLLDIPFIKNRLTRREIESRIPEKFNTKAKRLEQNKLNTIYVAKIIVGHFARPSRTIMSKYSDAFDAWQETQHKLIIGASKENFKTMNESSRDNKPYRFSGVYSANKPNDDYVLVMENCFTEPFASSPDPCDFAVNQFVRDHLLLQGVSEELSKDYYFFEKEHFVNHAMVRGIIVFDIYKKK